MVLLAAVLLIVATSAVPITKYPFFVTINTGFDWTCGGSIIAPDTVVTAASCLFNFQRQKWIPAEFIRVIEIDFINDFLIKEEEFIPCRSYKTHEFYNPFMNDHFNAFDIALIKLDGCISVNKPLTSIIHTCSKNDSAFKEGISIGIVKFPKIIDVEMETLFGARLFKYSHCGAFFESVGLKINKKTTACFNNARLKLNGKWKEKSGGPIISWTPDTNQLCLLGINIYRSKRIHDSIIPSVYIRADYFSDWIRRSMIHLSQSSDPTICRIF